jgi:hypothetical protein
MFRAGLDLDSLFARLALFDLQAMKTSKRTYVISSLYSLSSIARTPSPA